MAEFLFEVFLLLSDRNLVPTPPSLFNVPRFSFLEAF